ncbi:TPA: carboxymuconolactone decarboxylase family protein [Pseudomonas aeruginosa]
MNIFCRSGLDLKTRELSACAVLAAKGTKTSETSLRVHINAARQAGATSEEVVETLLNLLPYCGYPSVQAALAIAMDELSKRA